MNFHPWASSNTIGHGNKTNYTKMKKSFIAGAFALLALVLLNGCLLFSVGGGTKTENDKPSVGQQLIDLQKAKEAGAISDAEFQAQKAKLLGH
jgi:hypothetical protein